MSVDIDAHEIICWIKGQIDDCSRKSSIQFSDFNSQNSQFKRDPTLSQMENQTNAVNPSALNNKLNAEDKSTKYQINKAISDLQTEKYNKIREHIDKIYKDIKQRYNSQGNSKNNDFINNFNDILLNSNNAKKFPDIGELEYLVDRILELT